VGSTNHQFLGLLCFLVVVIVIGFVVIGIIIGKLSLTSSMSLAMSAADCISGVGSQRVEAVVFEQWGVQIIIVADFLVFTVVGIVVVSSFVVVIVIGFVIGICWNGVLSCWVLVLGVGQRDQERMLWHSALRSMCSGSAWEIGTIMVMGE